MILLNLSSYCSAYSKQIGAKVGNKVLQFDNDLITKARPASGAPYAADLFWHLVPVSFNEQIHTTLQLRDPINELIDHRSALEHCTMLRYDAFNVEGAHHRCPTLAHLTRSKIALVKSQHISNMRVD
jgi:hypothetical protein